jgi:chemotaxis protein CheX
MNMPPEASFIRDVTEQVWSGFLGIPVCAAAVGPAPAECAVRVAISGAWNGTVTLSCSRELARRAAAAMLGCAVPDVDEGSWRDAMSEIANILGGNLKAVLPGPSQLGLPEALDARAVTPDPQAVSFASAAGPLHVSVRAC